MKFLRWLPSALGLLMLVTIVLITLVVVLRYVFDIGFIALQEAALYSNAIVVLLGAAYAATKDAHVRIDLYYRRHSDSVRSWIDLAGFVFLLLPVCGFMFWISLDYVQASWEMAEGSREAGGLGGVYLLKTLFLVFPIALVLAAAARLIMPRR